MKYTVFHGTNQKFSKFSLYKSAMGVIWFCDSREKILDGGAGATSQGFILTCEIEINNPAGWDEYDKYSTWELKRLGFDGVILSQEDYNNYIVFSNEQIRILRREVITESFSSKILREAKMLSSKLNYLYHVTNIKNHSQIDSHGLLPQFGELIRKVYGPYYDFNNEDEDEQERQRLDFDGILFFSETPKLHYSQEGMSRMFSWWDTLLCIVKKNDTIFHKVNDYPKFTNYQNKEVYSIDGVSVENLPIIIETGDWFSFEEQDPIYLLTGEELKSFVKLNFPDEYKNAHSID